MHRSPRVMLAWTIAIVVAVATARIVLDDLGALHRRAHSLGRDVNVYVARRDLAIGHALSASDLTRTARPSSLVPPDALRDATPPIGRVVTVAALAGDVLRTRHFAPGDIPVGSRALHLVLKDGFRPPIGATVDILGASDEAARAVVLARAAHVRAVDDTGVTVLMPEDDAPGVAYAVVTGTIALALAPPG